MWSCLKGRGWVERHPRGKKRSAAYNGNERCAGRAMVRNRRDQRTMTWRLTHTLFQKRLQQLRFLQTLHKWTKSCLGKGCRLEKCQVIAWIHLQIYLTHSWWWVLCLNCVNATEMFCENSQDPIDLMSHLSLLCLLCLKMYATTTNEKYCSLLKRLLCQTIYQKCTNTRTINQERSSVLAHNLDSFCPWLVDSLTLGLVEKQQMMVAVWDRVDLLT